MYRQHIAKSLYLDCLPLRRKGEHFTCASLQYLYKCLIKASCYQAGSVDELEAMRLSEPRPSLFTITQPETDENKGLTCAFNAQSELKALPAPHLYIEVRAEEEEGVAALVTCARKQGLEMYIFRYAKEHQRWLWPFMGMRYGPTIKDIAHIAVLDPRTLSQMGPNAQKALIQEHAAQAALFIAALEGIRQGIYPLLASSEITQKPSQIAPISPSSFAQRARSQHKKRGPTKGSVRF